MSGFGLIEMDDSEILIDLLYGELLKGNWMTLDKFLSLSISLSLSQHA